jgi:hypothetical protein
MSYQALIQKLLDKGLLTSSLVELNSAPASSEQIALAENRLNIKLDNGLKEFYSIWASANLELLRILSPRELQKDDLGIMFANDPAGFIYRFDATGAVFSEDTDGGSVKSVADDFNDFIFGYVFGSRAADFMGSEWLQELRSINIAT